MLRRVVQEPSFSASRAHGHKISAGSLYSYFVGLEKGRFLLSPYEFEENWRNISKCNLTAEQLARILKGTQKGVSSIKDKITEEMVRDTILSHWENWQVPATDCISDFDLKDIIAILAAHRFLGISPQPDFLKSLSEKLGFLTNRMEAPHYSSIFSSAARLGFDVDHKIRNSFLGKLKNAENFLKNENKTPIIWSCAALDSIFPEENYKEIAERIRPHLPKMCRNTAAQKQRYDSHLWFDWPLPNKNVIRRDSEISNGEKKLADFIFEKLRIPVDASHSAVIPQLPQAIDLSVHYKRTAIYIEVDGPFHFLECTGEAESNIVDRYDGETRFRSALMHKLAPEERILRIPSNIQEIITAYPTAPRYSLECRKKLMLAYIEATLKERSGVYSAFLEGGKDTPCRIGIRSLLPCRP